MSQTTNSFILGLLTYNMILISAGKIKNDVIFGLFGFGKQQYWTVAS